MSRVDHHTAAVLLDSARRSRIPVAPISSRFDDFDLDDAYAVQSLQLDAWLSAGRTIVGRKVGLTSAAMQAQLGVDQPDFGVLLADMEVPDGGRLDRSLFVSPRVEPEIAFVLASPLRGPGVTVEQAAAAIGRVVASLEIIDSRIADWRIGLIDTVADNASSAGFVLGASIEGAPGLDLAAVECVFSRNGEVVSAATGAAVLGSPVNALVWLADTLGARGVGLEAGDVILPGSLTAAIPATPGDTIHAHFEGVGSVSVTVG
ncbi:MAG: hypothetical protein RI885_641 [Actinomycetota bacterium]|jgi:2-keto-4-pentenoate hydratase